jgi:DNA-binding YbaB/EbfC family protein
MKQLMEMKKQADRIKKELDAITVEVCDVPGIKVQMTGSQTFKSITLDENLLKPERKEQFQKDLLRSMNAAVKKAQTVAAQKMASSMPMGF